MEMNPNSCFTTTIQKFKLNTKTNQMTHIKLSKVERLTSKTTMLINSSRSPNLLKTSINPLSFKRIQNASYHLNNLISHRKKSKPLVNLREYQVEYKSIVII